jgi:hypothetical protein
MDEKKLTHNQRTEAAYIGCRTSNSSELGPLYMRINPLEMENLCICSYILKIFRYK